MNFKKGFTIVEIIIVIAIMAILTAIAIPSLNNVRAKNRDTERIADIGTIQLGLLNYYSKYGSYPTVLDPNDPNLKQYISADAFVGPDGKSYGYVPLTRSGSTNCTSYHLGTVLESPSGQIDSTDQFSSTVSGSSAMNGYIYCAGYSGSGLATGTLNYNIHPN